MTSYSRFSSLSVTATFAVLLAAFPAQAQNAQVSNVMTNALAARDLMPPADGSLWRLEGPKGILKGARVVSSIGLEPYSGRINEVAIDPKNPAIMYATGGNGGVWKTVD